MNNTSELSRMKALMNYGLQTEKKDYSSIEYSKVGADGKLYGIVREGTKYFIKVSDNVKKPLKENFDYIGGFRNRKDHEYSSYANALKQFDLKMLSLKEAKDNNSNIIIESWNPEKNEELALESTQKMRAEILRQRQIMSNAALIQEGKNGCCEDNAPFTCSADKEYLVGDGNKTECKPNMCKNTDKGTCADISESTEPLAWHREGDTKNDTFMDTSKGTEIGDTAPFDKGLNTNGKEASNGVVEEGESMHDSDNQNTPSVGTGEIGDTAPFDEKKEKLDEDLDDLGHSKNLDDSYDAEYDVTEDEEESPIDSAEDVNVDLDSDGEEEVNLDTYEDLNSDDDATELEDTTNDEDVNSRLDSIESLVRELMDKFDRMSDDSYSDEPLYSDDEEGEFDDEDPIDDEPIDDDEGEFGDEGPIDDEPIDDDEPTEIYESRSYRTLKHKMNEEQKLDYFGKHPAYRKEPMKLPNTGEDKNEHGEDWNDESVHNEKPYGEKIGSSAPFEISPKELQNFIGEAIKRVLNKKNKL